MHGPGLPGPGWGPGAWSWPGAPNAHPARSWHVSGQGHRPELHLPCWFPSLGSLPASFGPARPPGPSTLNLHPVEALTLRLLVGVCPSFRALPGTGSAPTCCVLPSCLRSRVRWSAPSGFQNHPGTQSSGKVLKGHIPSQLENCTGNVSLQPTPMLAQPELTIFSTVLGLRPSPSPSSLRDPRHPLSCLWLCAPLASEPQSWCRTGVVGRRGGASAVTERPLWGCRGPPSP